MIAKRNYLLLWLWLMASSPAFSAERTFPLDSRRILVLGDSITHAGHYVAWVETQLRLQLSDPIPEIINIGLGSETCSGLSEPDHPFPRPNVHDRLSRALELVKPDVVVACYGMNDGIYHPFSEERFEAYQAGVNRLIEKVHDAGAKLILMTPPPFDPVPLKSKGKLKPLGEEKYAYFAMYEDYDSVLERYGRWIMDQRHRVELVIDLHTPFMEFLKTKRQLDPTFTVTPDGIHPDKQGHRILGDVIARAWGLNNTVEPEPELLSLVTTRLALLHDAWLTKIGHSHPAVKPGLPLEEAMKKGAEMEQRIRDLVQARKR